MGLDPRGVSPGMCGFVGIQQDPDAPVSPEVLTRMARLLTHRGPDAEGYRIEAGTGLGHRRLSIIDLDTGDQPIPNEDESLWIVYNGEVYNYLELRVGLQRRGHRFRTKSDTEVIVHLYEEKGPDCVTDLRGMFAFAIWDRRDGSLFLARDRVGIKPLFFAETDRAFLFASEIKSLLAYPGFPAEIDYPSLLDYLSFRYVPAPRTLFRRVRKLPPGHTLLRRNGRARQARYWDVFREPHDPTRRPADVRESKARMLDLLKESVRLRLRSDVPLGAFLSGGIDSSTVVALMSRMVDRPVQTFSVGFDDPAFNELPFAREVAERYRTEHREIIVRPAQIPEDLPRLTWHRDAPVSEPTDVALFGVSRLARESVKVVLSGEGGDELFAGYAKYAVEPLVPLYQRIPEPLERACIAWPAERLPGVPRRLRAALRSLRQRDEAARYVGYFGSLDVDDRVRFLSDAFLEQLEGDGHEDLFARHMDRLAHRSPMDRMLYGDLMVWLPDNLLERGDRITMATSLEGRVPLLDHELVELAAGIPGPWKRPWLRTKHLLKETVKELLPPSLLRRGKVGFTVPVRNWFREELRDWVCDTLHAERTRRRGIFRAPEVDLLIEHHLAGRRDCSKELWMLVALELWLRHALDGETPLPATDGERTGAACA